MGKIWNGEESTHERQKSKSPNTNNLVPEKLSRASWQWQQSYQSKASNSPLPVCAHPRHGQKAPISLVSAPPEPLARPTLICFRRRGTGPPEKAYMKSGSTHTQEDNPETTRPEGPVFSGGWLHGIIVGVERSRELLLFRARETKKIMAIHWAPETQFAREGRPTSSSDLRSGQAARIHCRAVHHGLEADNISIGPANGDSIANRVPRGARPRPIPFSRYGNQ